VFIDPCSDSGHPEFTIEAPHAMEAAGPLVIINPMTIESHCSAGCGGWF
jgi:hypothetical protein